MEILLITPKTGKHSIYNDNKIVNFLFEHLDQYGDVKDAIQKCIDYVFTPNKGGLILLAIENNEIVGATIINKTGMSGYIPENILVYIAVNKNQRGKGVGKQIMQKAIENTEGDIALHVEKDNPAKFLYEKMGFTNPYLEMRLKK
ncbi:MAG: GNAT family N-acetyltransferase [Flavobacteriales bacterium]|nr:GNAT family N-acetyltransferase [Flavobacteriales bacterium]MCW8912808.1 GNAT family N-acetyltransferase [Flavobacteriales bacterium]MCW8938812.1 GNAT family N-acetyltransferase [Flavobacteriales bacterium]MCW8940927.1 GNAT family N-acetyltransferase [Flavobacteriales bacterium]MCW8968522.1 GNAT family N-acetyltransferase [Flavobacteriales bacterium]